MAEIKFPKLEIEPADLDRLESIIKRFEDVASELKTISARVFIANDYDHFVKLMDDARAGDTVVLNPDIEEEDLIEYKLVQSMEEMIEGEYYWFAKDGKWHLSKHDTYGLKIDDDYLKIFDAVLHVPRPELKIK